MLRPPKPIRANVRESKHHSNSISDNPKAIGGIFRRRLRTFGNASRPSRSKLSYLAPCWKPPGAILKSLVASWGNIGAVSGPRGAFLEPTLTLLDPPGGHPGPSRVVLEPSETNLSNLGAPRTLLGGIPLMGNLPAHYTRPLPYLSRRKRN